MKILHVVPNYDVGGHRSRIELLAAGLGSEFTHRVAALDGGSGAEPVEGVSLAPIQSAGSRFLNLGNLRRLHRLLRHELPQVLITYNWGAIESVLVNRLVEVAPHLHCEDGFGTPVGNAPEPRRRAVFRRLVLGRSRVVVPSRGLAEHARRNWGVPAERIELIANGIDAARFARARMTMADPEGRPLLVGTLSRLSAEKSVDLCIRAFVRVSTASQLRLLIAGDGPERPALEAEAARLGAAGRIVFLGHVGDPAAFLAGLDVYALTSATEQLPFSLLEAMAAGLPVAATDVGDVREALALPNREFVVPYGQEAAFAQVLGRLLEAPHLRRVLGAANAERARTAFDQQIMIEAYRSLLLKIIAPRLSDGE